MSFNFHQNPGTPDYGNSNAARKILDLFHVLRTSYILVVISPDPR